MTLQLELTPTEEQELQASAERHGVPLNEFAHRLLTSALRQQTIAQRRAALEGSAAKAYAASGETDEETEAYINAIVKEVRAELASQEPAR